MYLGEHEINDYLTFPANVHNPSTGAASNVDASTSCSYRIYEDETTAPITNGNMAALDASNTTGFYTERLQLLAATGFEVGKSYTIYISATVASTTGTMSHTFKIGTTPADLASIESKIDTIDTNVDSLITVHVGSGSVEVNHNYGGANALAYLTAGAIGIDNAIVTIYLTSEYDAGNRGEAYVKGRTTTDVNGQWESSIWLDPEDYTIVFFRQGGPGVGYGPDTAEITVA